MAPQPQADDKQESSSTQFDLEDFLSKLTLQPMVHGPGAPPMPPHDARSTMTPLVMRPGRHRKLYEIKGLAYLEQEATLFFSRASPRVENGEVFKSSNLSTQMASNPEQLQVAKYNPYEVDDRNAARFVTDRGPMKDAQQLAQKIDPELRELRFFTPRSDGALNDQNIDPIFFCKVDEKGYMSAVKCVVVLLPPWEFAPRDFDEFSTMATFDEGSANNNEQGDLLFCNADLMWAYIYDLCFMHECQHFILTTYEQWVFGGFSTYYSTGFVSQVIPWNFKPNSVLELLTYWILTACHMDDTIILEKIPKEKHIDNEVFEKERQFYCKPMPHDGLLDAELDPISEAERPAKFMKDPLEESMGWESFDQHADVDFPSPRKSKQLKPTAAEYHRKVRRPNVFARPSLRWNKWAKKRVEQEKENPSLALPNWIIPKEKQSEITAGPSRPRFGRPIPCYSLDIDRINDCFRPELIGLALG